MTYAEPLDAVEIFATRATDRADRAHARADWLSGFAYYDGRAATLSNGAKAWIHREMWRLLMVANRSRAFAAEVREDPNRATRLDALADDCAARFTAWREHIRDRHAARLAAQYREQAAHNRAAARERAAAAGESDPLAWLDYR